MKLEINVTSGKLKLALPTESDERASLVLVLFSGEGLKGIHAAAVEELTGGLVSRRIANDGFDPKFKQSKVIDTDLTIDGLDKIILVGLGRRSKLTMDGLRKALAAAFVEARDTAHAEHLIFPLIDVDLRGFSVEQFAQVVAEYAVLADYEPNHKKTRQWRDEMEQTHFKSLTVVSTRGTVGVAKRGVEFGKQLGVATRLARDLVNEQAKTMTARKLGRVAMKIAAESEGLVTAKVHTKREIQKLKMGGLLAVNQGSIEPPTFIELSYDPPSGATEEVIGLVGKGVTFDTGGLDIKDWQSMKDMKSDMGGAAAVLGAMSLIRFIKPRYSVRAVIAATDNQINGKPMQQGDIIKSMSGLSVEVGHTDCEGRLTLMDALHYIQTKMGATKVLDFATLTGAIEEAVGVYVTGVFGNDDRFTRKFLRAAEYAGEPMHEFPMDEEIYRDGNKGDMADLTNDGQGPGHIIAAWFLREFIKENVSWVHCDIAGTSWRTDATAFGIESNGGTGVAVRSIVHFLCENGY